MLLVPFSIQFLSWHSIYSFVGIILGTIIVLVCILICIICLLLKRRCLKRRASSRSGLATSNNLYPAVAHYATHADSVHVRLEDICAQESQHLVQENITTNIPPMTSNFIDSKVPFLLHMFNYKWIF